MHLKFLASAALAAAITLGNGGAQASVQIVNISASGPAGTIVALAAGSYTIHFVDASVSGGYGGYSPWSSNSGCDGLGMNCSTGFVENLGIDFGFGAGNFNRIDGYQHGLLTEPGNNHIFATGAQAIADIEAGDIVRAPLPQANDTAAYSPIGGPISFTLAAAQDVNFFILDNPYGDNRGGVSISLDDGLSPAVPEPASWALMIGGFAMAGGVMRRRRMLRLA